MINRAEHCRLCQHQEVDLTTGTTCGLTNKKPDFHESCPTINFSEKLEHKIKETNSRYQNIRRKSSLTYIYSLIILAISFAIVIGGWYFGKYVYDAGVLSALPVLIIGVGCLLFPAAFGPLNYHRRDLKMAKIEKDKIDKILSLYNINYSIEIQFGKQMHGSQEVFADLNLEKPDKICDGSF